MNKLDLNERNGDGYQRVVHEFDRIPAGSSLLLLSNRDPGWIVEMIEEVRSNNLVGYEFTEEAEHAYAVKLRKNRHIL